MVECCPSPSNPVIVPNQKTESQRKSLHAIMYGEIGAAICRAYTLGFLTGVLHLLTIWIDYLGYATMHYCQVMVIAFCGGIEMMMLWMNANDGGPLEEMINASSLTLATYYAMLAFSGVKCLTAFHVHQSFKEEFINFYGESHQQDSYLMDPEDGRYNSDRQQAQGNRQEQMLREAQFAEQDLQQQEMYYQNQAQRAQRREPRAQPGDFAPEDEDDVIARTQEQNTATHQVPAPTLAQPSATPPAAAGRVAPSGGFRMPNTMSDAELNYHMEQTRNHQLMQQREWERRHGQQPQPM